MLSIVPLSQISLFAAFFAAAIANIRRPETHKRLLMLLATVNLLTAAIARFFVMLLVPDRRGLPNFAATPLADASMALIGASIAAGIVDLIVVAALVRDWRVRGRPHRAYVIGLACMILVHVLRPSLAQTGLWRSIVGGLAALAA